MDDHRFDALTRTLRKASSRRGVVHALGASALAVVAARLGLDDAEARKKGKGKKKRRNKKQQKPKLNAFGCVNVGGSCENGGQCCSGICQGKKGKEKCQAHDASTCAVGQTIDDCGGTNELCTSSDGAEGVCVTTTGNAAYCATSLDCFPCQKDSDCEPVCGPGAACFPCAEECDAVGNTACAAAGGAACNFQ